MKIFYAFVLFCACCNAAIHIHGWYTGAPADGIVWLFAIAFSVGVAVDSLGFIFGEGK